MSEARRDVGLLRAVGPWALAASTVNIVVGGGIFAVPAPLAASVGAYAPLVFLVCALAVGAVAICFAEGGSRVPTSGGPYGYIEAALGPLAAFVGGTLLWVGEALALGGISTALADAVVTLLPTSLRGAMHPVVVVAVVGVIAMVNVWGVKRGAGLAAFAAVVKLGVLVLFVGVGLTAVRAAAVLEAPAPSGPGLGHALILALFTFMGMETSLGASGEVTEPSRTIPRALALSMACLAVLFVAIQLVAQGLLGAALATSPAPLADAMGTIHPALRTFVLAGTAFSLFGWIGTDLLGTPRMLFAMARDGWLPRFLARVHPRTHAPHVAILAYAALAIALSLSGTFAELAVLSALATAPIYVLGCIAAWILARRGVARSGAALGFRWLGPAAIVGAASMLLMVALASRAEIVGLGVLLGLAIATYLLRARWALRSS